ncbi:hypothetical protein [Calothrix sp. UHCC 0171]|uniref:hypothetical protein n=1 Tax=Calothrix sp. UHCC 0171 TaxID=3110245 RepID=UPI002B1E9450|nr:hypothetical protein [Calothrix sp. UHCC 0171]MEA5572310.1 hypothetical protein [Calothrix sp. UHCC 0171]
MSLSNQSPDSPLQRLREVRRLLLRLHKALLDSEKIVYEQVYGQIKSNGEFLSLVIGHEWFNWLHQISQLIVRIDEVLFAKKPVAMEQPNQLLEQTKNLLQPDNEGTTLGQRYFHAIQRDPEIALMHVELSEMLAQA